MPKQEKTKKSATDHKESSNHVEVGAGGEIHQTVGGTHPPMTSQFGLAISDDENSLKANTRGPVLLEDRLLVEKTQHFDHERIPERIVHARGVGAHGYFELTDSLKGISKAGIFNRVGEKTEVFTRFSTVAGKYGIERYGAGCSRFRGEILYAGR